MQTSNDIERRVAAARELARGLEGQEGVVGAFLHGSSIRPYGDDASDLDIALVVEDGSLPAAAAAGAHQKLWEEGRRVADLSWYARSVFVTPHADQERFRATHARVLFDRGGALATLLSVLSELPPAVAAERMRVHYFEVTSLAAKILSAQRRARADAVQLLAAQLVLCSGKLLTLSRSAWPAPTTWMFEELVLVGVPDHLVGGLRRVLESPQARELRSLRGALDEYLLGAGATFVGDPAALLDWIYGTQEGLRAVASWGLATG